MQYVCLFHVVSLTVFLWLCLAVDILLWETKRCSELVELSCDLQSVWQTKAFLCHPQRLNQKTENDWLCWRDMMYIKLSLHSLWSIDISTGRERWITLVKCQFSLTCFILVWDKMPVWIIIHTLCLFYLYDKYERTASSQLVQVSTETRIRGNSLPGSLQR